MNRRRRAFSLSDLLFLFVVLLILGAIVLPMIASAREWARRSKCAKQANQIVTAHCAYATDQFQRGQPETFLAGTEPVTGKGSGGKGTDGSRALANFVKRGYPDSAAAFACPSDPFVAVLDGVQGSLGADDTDLPADGKPAPRQWASPKTVASVEPGHTFFSYSTQSGSKNRFADTTPRLHSKLPLIAERNPFCGIFAELAVGRRAEDRNGNTWNHNREGQTLAFPDGHSRFLTDAGALEIPLDPTARNPFIPAFDNLYNDEAPAVRPSRLNGKCVTAGTAAFASAAFGSWVTD